VLDDLCQQAGFKPKIRFESYEVGSLHGLVGAGFGVTLAPRRMVSQAACIDVPISAPDCHRVVGVSWRKERWLPPKASAFRNYLIRELPAMKLNHHEDPLRPIFMSGLDVKVPLSVAAATRAGSLKASSDWSR
jgi:hypothetical protein